MENKKNFSNNDTALIEDKCLSNWMRNKEHLTNKERAKQIPTIELVKQPVRSLNININQVFQ